MSEWISVKDRLPEVGNYYLVYLECGNVYHDKEMVVLPYNGTTKKWYGTICDLTKFITHWMPLPEKPKKYNERKEQQ